jgi:SAM-dependent methyltransferase
MVREYLASGREVVLQYDLKGRPIQGLDARSFSAAWLNDAAWHPAGVAVAEVRNDNTIPHPIPSREIDVASWLALTYEYLSPILGVRSLPFSSLGLFRKEISEELLYLPRQSRVLEVGGGMSPTPTITSRLVTYILSPEKPIPIPGTRVIQGIVECIPVEDGYFCSIICQFVLEHLLNPLRALQEMVRSLICGGQLVLSIPVDHSIQGKPPLFHRWRFVFDADKLPPRTIALNSIDLMSLGLSCQNGGRWIPKVQSGDACLFILSKSA